MELVDILEDDKKKVAKGRYWYIGWTENMCRARDVMY